MLKAEESNAVPDQTTKVARIITTSQNLGKAVDITLVIPMGYSQQRWRTS